MASMNSIIQVLDNPPTRWILRMLIFLRYKQRGRKIEAVKSHKDFGAWEFRIDGVSYLSSGPGWAYDYEYLLTQLKELSGYAYLPIKGDTVIDIGAGVGEETIIFSDLVGSGGKVYSVEAHPKTFRALSYLVAVNDLKNVVHSNVALSDIAGTVSIDDSDNSLANTILSTPKKKAFEVDAETFDDFVERNNIDRIDLVKMNVEGAEQLIIRGMQRSLSRIKHMAISCHDFRYKNGESEFFKTKDIVLQFLEKSNFVVVTQNTANSMVDDYVYAYNPLLTSGFESNV
ncbi:hypothetical protein SanaruYs_22780 [Chryseotalea sanaruensis]|uniref:Methyltransferase FkbM domain-containing protein n=1 Tax=Chryseotalea sanaruensis TaxID=2482724 RepID=A0A401UAW1_9BACT|nr:FkbM family methyltransferase [Chryseotalea sanaruensis]GCC52046.1 hypothetical protein SanaruYs_22780 [Chryseotalea sanaruensis]